MFFLVAATVDILCTSHKSYQPVVQDTILWLVTLVDSLGPGSSFYPKYILTGQSETRSSVAVGN